MTVQELIDLLNLIPDHSQEIAIIEAENGVAAISGFDLIGGVYEDKDVLCLCAGGYLDDPEPEISEAKKSYDVVRADLLRTLQNSANGGGTRISAS